MWYDRIGRQNAAANYGTNNNVGPPVRPSISPASSEMVLVSETRYSERGEAFETVDPSGMVNRTISDDAGRTVRAIQNYNAQAPAPVADENVTTEMEYGPGGHLVKLIAVNASTGNQVTEYLYGTTLADSELASNDLLRSEIYPDSEGPTDSVRYGYNRQGQRIEMTDQNGSVHEYDYDLLGRQTADRVTVLGDGVDGSIRRIGTSYDVRGLEERITSYDAATAGNVVNEVQNIYNGFGQLITQYQEHDGAVNTGTTPKVEYGYVDGTGNTIRQTSMTYPNGRVLQYLYDDAAADKLSRIRTLRWDGVDVCRYSYLGLRTFITTDYLQPQVKLDYALGAGSDPYTGFDRFGRIVDLLWERYGASSSSSSSGAPGNAAVHLKYGYDLASNRTFREDLVAKSYGKYFDELYEYDGVHRLKAFHRGELTNNNQTIANPILQQGWALDSTGNWDNFTQDDPTDPSQDLDQQRMHNRVNEITDIARTVGADWATPEHDNNGNMSVIPQPKERAITFHATWDAWNRLVKLIDSATLATVQGNVYDGFKRRIAQTASGVTRHYYYSEQWQMLEEHAAGPASSSSSSVSSGVPSAPDRQFVWGLRYIDDLVLRDDLAASPSSSSSSSSGGAGHRVYALQDALFSVVALSNALGAVVERYAYDAYGSPRFLDATDMPLTPQQSGIGQTHLFTGQRLDDETGLYSYRARYYSALIGRFISRDPIAYFDGRNLYQYVRSHPLRYIDSLGLFAEEGACCEQPAPGMPNAYNLDPVGILHGTGGGNPTAVDDLMLGVDEFQVLTAILEIAQFGVKSVQKAKEFQELLWSTLDDKLKKPVDKSNDLTDLAQAALVALFSKIESQKGFTLWIEIEYLSCDERSILARNWPWSSCCYKYVKHKKEVLCKQSQHGGYYGGAGQFPLPTLDDIANCIKDAEDAVLNGSIM